MSHAPTETLVLCRIMPLLIFICHRKTYNLWHSFIVFMHRPHWFPSEEVLLYLACSSNLVPCNFFLFSHPEKCLRGKRFGLNAEVMPPQDYFNHFQKSYFLDGLWKLKYPWKKCIELKGDCVEK